MNMKRWKRIWTNIKSNFRTFLNSLFVSKLFLQNLFYIGGIMMLFFLVFALSTYKQSYDILQNEFSSFSEYHLETTANAVDNHLKDMRYIIATLEKSSLVQAFFPTKIRKDCMTDSKPVYRNPYNPISTAIPPLIPFTCIPG
ncbi:MAG: hypothetical protein IKK03_01050 [Lachnospiraceae bacterium]|nr:hypothetical protein [Lachnospiraceae bacterium]